LVIGGRVVGRSDRVVRRRLFVSGITVLFVVVAVVATALATGQGGGGSPDLPPSAQHSDHDAGEHYLHLRDEYIGELRGVDPQHFFDPHWRLAALAQRFHQERAARRVDRARAALSSTQWTEIGPDSVVNGHALNGSDTRVSGRVTAIAFDPSNPSRVYIGTAQGGVWRTSDGGSTWFEIFDTAKSLSIGALALAPSSPTTLYVGTGESSLSASSFFGVGVYRIDDAPTIATLVGPLNRDAGGNDILTGRSISRILVDPSNAARIFVSSSSGVAGSGSSSAFLPTRGVFRSMNAASAASTVTFSRLAIQTATADRSVNDMTFVGGDPNTLLVHVNGSAAAGDGGIWKSVNALAVTPTFNQVLTVSASQARFAVSGTTVLFADAEGSGRLRESTNGGDTWSAPLPAASGFCGGQCFYDLPVAIDPRTSGSSLRIYLGGSSGAAQPGASGLKVSNDNGASFSVDQNGLHADFHVIAVQAQTNPSIVWVGNDGGVWKRPANAPVGTLWTNLNNGLGTLQFTSLAVGKSDPALTIGGTQDNGTEIQQGSIGSWSQADFGDGGYALIDQSTTSTTDVTLYHTYYNATGGPIGFARVTNTAGAVKGGWSLIACRGNPTTLTGINCTDNVLFYPPMALGPGTPSTLYFGTDRLYRSTDRGATLSCGCALFKAAGVISPLTFSPTSSIAISPQDDNYRLVGLQNGELWGTTTGSGTLSQMTGLTAPPNASGSTFNKFVGRVMFDPNDKNTAYATFAYYTTAGAGFNVYKTTNFNNATPTWTPAANGIPNVPVDSFAIDPDNSEHLYAGTDVGVYASTDGGASWAPLGTRLPAVAVFDMAIVQPRTSSEKLRVATYGRSIWEIDLVR
jgi:hypothetical protein